jgi:23S rRNA (cytidine1920-2'-O)/16S rRNA (cytidine1409-2'-O)-methyltransferase
MKKRVDILLAEKGLTKSREKAKIQIISGNVYANGKQVKNPSDTLDEDATIELRADACPYVSRGGLKLEKALQEFRINLEGKTCADIGASTGGFTDCMLTASLIGRCVTTGASC